MARIFWRHPERQRVRTALPGTNATRHAPHSCLCLRRDHRLIGDWAPAQSQSALYLQPTPPHSNFKHAVDKPRTGYQPASSLVPALVSFFALKVPWVSWFPSVANTTLGAAVRPSYSTKSADHVVRQSRFQGANLEDPLTANRLLVPSTYRLLSVSRPFRHRPLQNLPASAHAPFMVELFAAGFRQTPDPSRPDSACHQVGSSPRRP